MRHKEYPRIKRQFIVTERIRASKAVDLDSGATFAVKPYEYQLMFVVITSNIRSIKK